MTPTNCKNVLVYLIFLQNVFTLAAHSNLDKGVVFFPVDLTGRGSKAENNYLKNDKG